MTTLSPNNYLAPQSVPPEDGVGPEETCVLHALQRPQTPQDVQTCLHQRHRGHLHHREIMAL